MGTHYRGPAEEIRALDAYIKLMRAAKAVGARVEDGLRELGLTENQFGVLEMLFHLGPLRQCDIGRRLLTSRANVTLLVDQLVARGLVRRARGERDRRAVVIHLTQEGRASIERNFPSHAARIASVFAALSAEDQERLAKLCRTLGLGAAS